MDVDDLERSRSVRLGLLLVVLAPASIGLGLFGFHHQWGHWPALADVVSVVVGAVLLNASFREARSPVSFRPLSAPCDRPVHGIDAVWRS